MKYALYVTLVEDTEEADAAMGEDCSGESMERIAGNLEYDEAQRTIRAISSEYGNSEKA